MSYETRTRLSNPSLVSDIWDGFSHRRLPNQTRSADSLHLASREQLFIILGVILTKWRNRSSTQNLMLLAELKMYFYEEHVYAGSVRKHHLK